MPTTRRLVYLYAGSEDVDRDVSFYRSALGAELVWRVERDGTIVAAMRLGDEPLVLLADHREPGRAVQLWSVDDLEGELRSLGEHAAEARRLELPDGPCLLLSDPSGNEIGLLQRTRPDAMTRHDEG